MKYIKSVAILNKGPVAQRLEQYTHNVLVPGSNPGGPTSLINIYNKNFEYEKTISIRVSDLKNYCPIFYGRSRNWVETG